MKISINTIRFLNKHFGSAGDPAPDGAEALVEKIGAQLGGVEETVNFGERYKDVVIARIARVRDHTNSNHLHVCKIDDGGKTPNVERDENGHVQVVCGAPNLREDMLVAWLPPGTTVPESIIKGESFVLEARDLRGEMSNGMLASPRELGIGDNHDGVLEIILDGDEQVEPGTSFAEAYHLDGDVIIDIENKMFTHRPDCFGLLGVAREIAGIQGQAYKSPDWYTLDADILPKNSEVSKNPAAVSTGTTAKNLPTDSSPELLQQMLKIKSDDVYGRAQAYEQIIRKIDGNAAETDWDALRKSLYGDTSAMSLAAGISSLPLRVRNELPELVPRFVAVALQDVQVHESPLWMQLDLAKSGIRPINNIVDYTNWYMIETGQPLHAYDYDKLRALDAHDNPMQAALDPSVNDANVATIVVRHPKPDEKILLLNGKEIEPRAEAIMIASEQKLIGVGGVMGGGETEVDEHTRNIVIECATFDMYSIRKTSMAHGLFTDAVTRFSKGQSPLQNRAVAAKIASEIARFAGGKIVGVVDNNHVPGEVMARGSLHPAVKIAPRFVNARLGLKLSADDITKLLENVEFKVVRTPKPARVVLLHGSRKTSADAWYPWFKKECETNGVVCDMPDLPPNDPPILADWLAVLENLKPDTDTVLVGHSRGGMAILRWLEQAPENVRVRKVVLVAANNPGIPDEAGGDFYASGEFDFAKIRSHCDEFVLFHSKDDDFVPLAAGKKNAEGLHGLLRVYRGMQHFGNNLTRMPAILNEVMSDGELLISAPFWRTDIEIREDVVEEVGRLYGYDHLPLTLPKRDLTPAAKNSMLALKSNIRSLLAISGANEVLTYSFVHGKLLDRAGQNREQAFRLSNALSPDLQYYRLSLTPSLLDKIHANIKAGYDEFALFEMGMVHDVSEKDAENLPSEPNRIALVYAANEKLAKSERAGAPFYQARAFVENLLHGLQLHDFKLAEYINVSSEVGFMKSWQTPFAPHRSAIIMATVSGHENTVVGFVGEYKPEVRQKLKLPDYCAGFELDLWILQTMQAEHGTASSYTQLPSFPKIEQDICLKVPASLAYRDLYDFARTELEKLVLPKSIHSLTPVDIFSREDSAGHKQVTLRLTIASYEKTLRDEEVAKMLDALATAAHEKFQAERV